LKQTIKHIKRRATSAVFASSLSVFSIVHHSCFTNKENILGFVTSLATPNTTNRTKITYQNYCNNKEQLYSHRLSSILSGNITLINESTASSTSQLVEVHKTVFTIQKLAHHSTSISTSTMGWVNRNVDGALIMSVLRYLLRVFQLVLALVVAGFYGIRINAER